MPGALEILQSLTDNAQGGIGLATVWHIVIGGALLRVLTSTWRPRLRGVAAGLAMPLLTVSLVSWTSGNPFNGVTFAVAGLLLLLFGVRLTRDRATPAPRWALIMGALAFGYGWFYPHFLPDYPMTVYLFAAPVGVVPCPTLALVTGLALAGGGFGSRPWSITLVVMGLFYSLFGMFYLGVWLDAGLLVAALSLLVFTVFDEGAQASGVPGRTVDGTA